MKIIEIAFIPFTMILIAMTSTAAANTPISIGLKASTLGLGIEAGFRLSDTMSLRAQYNHYDFTETATDADITYNYKLGLDNWGILADWHPSGGAFRVTAGLYSNNNAFTGTANGTFTVGNAASQQIGLQSTIDFASTAPYLGIGWGHAAANNSGLSFNADIGVLMQDSPQVSLVQTSGTAVSQADLTREAQQLENDISEFDAYPVLSFGMAYTY